MFQITPKEQILKNIRKGLVQPNKNKFPLLNFEKNILNKSLVFKEDGFIKFWISEGFYFQSYTTNSELIYNIKSIIQTNNVSSITILEKEFMELFLDNGIKSANLEKKGQTIISSFSKIDSSTFSISFSSEIHPISFFQDAGIIILIGKNNQIQNAEIQNENEIKSELKIQLNIKNLKIFSKVYLFIRE